MRIDDNERSIPDNKERPKRRWHIVAIQMLKDEFDQLKDALEVEEKDREKLIPVM